MTSQDYFKSVLISADPSARKYKTASRDTAYTVWSVSEFDENAADDDVDEDLLTIYVDRFSKCDNDPIPVKLCAAFKHGGIPFEHVVYYDATTDYIHHSFKCTVLCGKEEI
ncbi:MAG: hypothetical protein RRY79_05020 [Clostridia bacterium]